MQAFPPSHGGKLCCTRYLLTNLPDLKTAIHIYSQRFGIEAMFRDCKTGGYNLEGSKASPDRLVRLILLIAISLTSAWLQGQRTLLQRQQPYVCRTQEKDRTRKRHSSFWIGLYGQNWIFAFHECQVWVEELNRLVRKINLGEKKMVGMFDLSYHHVKSNRLYSQVPQP